MSVFHIYKELSELPTVLEPNSLYLVRVGIGFNLYCTDITGNYAHTVNTPISGLTAEEVDDRVANLLVAGANTTLTYDDVANTLTIDSAGGGSGLTAEEVDDRVAALIEAGPGITTSYDDNINLLTIESTITEYTDQDVANLLTAGTNITLDYDDNANTLTINSTASGGGGGSSVEAYTLGDGVSTIYNVTHTFASFDVIVNVYRNSGDRPRVLVQTETPDINTVRLTFNPTIPAIDEYRVVIIG